MVGPNKKMDRTNDIDMSQKQKVVVRERLQSVGVRRHRLILCYDAASSSYHEIFDK